MVYGLLNRRRDSRMLPCHVMRRTDVFQIRIEPEFRDRLARLRDERHVNVNVSAWARDVIAAALDCEFPADLEAPKRQALAGWRPCKLGDGWGAVLDGPDVAALAEDPRGTPIQHHRQPGRLLDGHDHRGRLPQPAAHRRPRLRPAVGVHAPARHASRPRTPEDPRVRRRGTGRRRGGWRGEIHPLDPWTAVRRAAPVRPRCRCGRRAGLGGADALAPSAAA